MGVPGERQERAAPLGGAGADANTPAMLGNASVGDEAAKAGLPDAFSRAKDNCGSFEMALLPARAQR